MPIFPGGGGGGSGSCCPTQRQSADYVAPDVLYPALTQVNGQAPITFGPSSQARVVLVSFDVRLRSTQVAPGNNEIAVAVQLDGNAVFDFSFSSVSPTVPQVLGDVMIAQMLDKQYTIPGDSLPHVLALIVNSFAGATTDVLTAGWPRLYVKEGFLYGPP